MPPRRRYEVLLQSPIESTNARGESVVTGWNTVGTVRVQRGEATGREAFIGQQVFGSRPVLFQAGFRAGVTTKMRLLEGSRVYDIVSVSDPNGRRRELAIIALERGI